MGQLGIRKYLVFVLLFSMSCVLKSQDNKTVSNIIRDLDSNFILTSAQEYLRSTPITITNFRAANSAGGIHDFYSEGDYWWPDPENPDGPYIRKDGMTNPDNFVKHRQSLIDMSVKVAALTSAYKITKDLKYADKAMEHLRAWFIAEKTKMNPNLLYAQAIKGRFTGRGIGIIDTIHLVEVVQAIIVLEKDGVINSYELNILKKWFKDYLLWMTTHQYGIDERDNGNNHSTCWAMQVAQYSKFVRDFDNLIYCRKMFTDILIPTQMAKDGSFPKELSRTKPYGYSLFNLDIMSMVCEIISDNENNYWHYSTSDGKSIGKALEFMYPYIKEKSTWPYMKDVMYWNDWPVRHPSLLFASMALNKVSYLDLWNKLNGNPTEGEIIRNFPIRQPILWIN